MKDGPQAPREAQEGGAQIIEAGRDEVCLAASKSFSVGAGHVAELGLPGCEAGALGEPCRKQMLRSQDALSCAIHDHQ